jgi:hypothetical protein
MAAQHAVEPTPAAAPGAVLSAEEYWTRWNQYYLDLGYSWLGAQEAVNARFPKLWQEATAERTRRTRSGLLPSAPYKARK